MEFISIKNDDVFELFVGQDFRALNRIHLSK